MSYDQDAYGKEEWAELVERFADPGGRSALHPASRENTRKYPCPDCGQKNRLTRRDVAAHYCCDECADRKEGGGY